MRSDGSFTDPVGSGAPSKELSQGEGSGRLSFESSCASEPGGDAGGSAAAAARKLPPATSLGSIDEGEERWGQASRRSSLQLPAPIPEGGAAGAAEAEPSPLEEGSRQELGGSETDDLASQASSEALALAAATEVEQHEDEALEAAAQAAEMQTLQQRQHSGWGRLRALIPRKERESPAGAAAGSHSGGITLPTAASLRSLFAPGHAGAPDQDSDGR